MASTIFILIGLLLAIIGIGVWISALRKHAAYEREGSGRYPGEFEPGTVGKWVGLGLGIGGVLLAGILLLTSTIVVNGQGEAKVVTNIDGSVAQTIETNSTVTKAPWQDFVDFDLFSQELLYAGGDVAPSYSGGQVNGKEVTVSVGGLNGGSTQANIDISVVYSLDAGAVEDIYKKYRTQERFTKQIIEKTVLSVARTVPSQFTAITFRGAEKDAAAQEILQRVNDKLNKLGVTVDFVNIQAVRYPDNVETALNDVEAANQAAALAEANQRKAEVEAETKRIEAQGVADANAILTQSLTPQILQQRYIDALKAGTVYVVPEGSTPFVGVK